MWLGPWATEGNTPRTFFRMIAAQMSRSGYASLRECGAGVRHRLLAAETPYGMPLRVPQAPMNPGAAGCGPLAGRHRVAPGQSWIQRCRALSDVPGPARVQVPPSDTDHLPKLAGLGPAVACTRFLPG